jgi:UDP-glucose 4-epimerase
MRILVTGGAGYVGSHVALELLLAGHDVVIIDSLDVGSRVSVDRLAEIAQAAPRFVQADLRDSAALDELFAGAAFDAVMHFAALKSPSESAQRPLQYYDCNVGGAVALVRAMASHGVYNFVFSSSAAVYGEAQPTPVPETADRVPSHPYGRSKLMVERVLEDLAASDDRWSITVLRYFNVAGAHPSGRIGENLNRPAGNLVARLGRVASGEIERLQVFGDDFSTPDGTGVRDFVHVVDIALGHLRALDVHGEVPGLHVYNLGAGQGVSVLQMRAAFEQTCGRPIPYEVVARRPGDVAHSCADVSLAAERLGWRAERSLGTITADAWRWMQSHPTGDPLIR